MTTVKNIAIVIVGGMVLIGAAYVSYQKSQQDRRNQVIKSVDESFNSGGFYSSTERYILDGSMDFSLAVKRPADSLTDALYKNNKRIALVQDFSVPQFFEGDKTVSSTYISSIASGMNPNADAQCVVDGVNVCFDTSITRPTSKASNEIKNALDEMGYKIVAVNK